MKLQILCLALVLIAIEANAAKQGINATIPALIVFGDSIMDTGNNNNLHTLLKCNFPPYGKDYPGGFATGRFSDGRVPSDLIAEKLGLAKTLPAYMNPYLKPEDLLKGVTFASGGTGYDPLTAKIMSVISVWDQLIYFKEYISKIKKHFGEEKAKEILEHSFFLVVSSSNDLAHTYLAQAHRYDRTSYANFLADSAVHFVRELHKLGARKIGVFSAVPVGCVPLQRTVFGGFFTRRCNQPLNNMAKQFNARLSPALDSLDKELDGVILYINVYDTLFDMIQHPKKYGFEVADKGCCGKGLLTISYLWFTSSKMAERGGERGAERGGDRGNFGRGFGGGRGGGRDRGPRGRGRRGGRASEEAKWVPVTKLGRLVLDNKITKLEEIYLHSLPVKEYQIIDLLVGPSLKDEVMKIMPVQKQTRAGQRTRFKAFVVVGDGNGHVGLGVKCSKEVATAIRGAIILAKLSVVPVRRGYWGNKIGKPHTVPCKVTGKCGSVTVRMVPAPRGAGIVAARVPKKVLQFAGIDDVFTSSRGSTKTLGNFVKATFDCLQKTYGFLTPEFWKETRFSKSPYQEYTDFLATKAVPAAKVITEGEDQA
ncbi:unnamed protein product [Arabidopsis lyrata]|nr:unnamed protein product [Arabidopsis lyrata]